MTRRRATTRGHKKPAKAEALTLREHLSELRKRLFFVALVFLAVAGLAFPFFDQIVNFLVMPLGSGHELVYLTPGGAFTFMMQVCIYAGLIGALPALVYNLYKFIMPAVGKIKLKKIITYTGLSVLFAAAGIAFSYFVVLPAAINFLTGFEFRNINPMLTIDSYLSFVMTYLLAGAALFQLPLVINLIDSIKPLTPLRMMKAQQYIILGSFIAAAVISPTPDVINQTLLAAPIIVMYQIAVIAIWIKHRKRSKTTSATTQPAPVKFPPRVIKAEAKSVATANSKQSVKMPEHVLDVKKPVVAVQKPKKQSIDGFVTGYMGKNLERGKLVVPSRPSSQMRPRMADGAQKRQSVDGFFSSPAVN